MIDCQDDERLMNCLAGGRLFAAPLHKSRAIDGGIFTDGLVYTFRLDGRLIPRIETNREITRRPRLRLPLGFLP